MIRPRDTLKDIGMSVQSSKTSVRHARVNPVNPGCPSGVVEGGAGLVDFIKGVVPLKVVFPMLGLRVASGSPCGGGVLSK